jgi:hypothetical protein
MTRDQDRWKLASKSDEPKELIEGLLKDLHEIDMKGYLPGYSGPALETFETATKSRAEFAAHLSQLLRALGTYSPADLASKASNLTGDLDESIRTLKSHLNALGYWVKWIEGEISENEGQKAKVKAIQTSIDGYNEWLKVKVKPKKKTKLGTSIQFELVEVSRRDESWLVYYADADTEGKFRIIQQGNIWRLDKQSITWDAVNNVEYRKPEDAAKALEALLR